jgi:hypothetical protein
MSCSRAPIASSLSPPASFAERGSGCRHRRRQPLPPRRSRRMPLRLPSPHAPSSPSRPCHGPHPGYGRLSGDGHELAGVSRRAEATSDLRLELRQGQTRPDEARESHVRRPRLRAPRDVRLGAAGPARQRQLGNEHRGRRGRPVGDKRLPTASNPRGLSIRVCFFVRGPLKAPGPLTPTFEVEAALQPPRRNGLCARSAAIVVSGPWPVITRVSSGSVSKRFLIDLRIAP